MALTLAWILFVLGFGHIAYGLAKFRVPLIGAAAAGYIGQFSVDDARRAAFWFVIFGPLLVLAGHVAIHAVQVGDLPLLRLVGAYMSAISVAGFAAFPKSPFLAGMVVSPLLLVASYGII